MLLLSLFSYLHNLLETTNPPTNQSAAGSVTGFREWMNEWNDIRFHPWWFKFLELPRKSRYQKPIDEAKHSNYLAVSESLLVWSPASIPISPSFSQSDLIAFSGSR